MCGGSGVLFFFFPVFGFSFCVCCLLLRKKGGGGGGGEGPTVSSPRSATV